MQYLAAYTLATLSGKEPTEQDVINILKATGKDVDAAKVTDVVNKLKGKPVHQLISKGQSKVGSVGGSAGGKTEAPKAEKKTQAEKPKGKQAPPPVEEPAAQDEDFNLDLFG